MELFDMHGHFLPGMDDGCKTPEEAVQLLKSSYAQGVRSMCATPHYYPVETAAAFLERREQAYSRLLEALDGETDIPQICLGAEVAYRPGLGYWEELHKLCLGNSSYLLLEMPFGSWNRETVRDVRNMCLSGGITPIIAHVERYLDIAGKDKLAELLEMDVLVQMNARYLLQPATRRRGRKMLENGTVQLLGSDCHNLTDRPPNLGQAAAYLTKKGMGQTLAQITALSSTLLREATEPDRSPENDQ